MSKATHFNAGMKNILTLTLIAILWAVGVSSGFKGLTTEDLYVFAILGMMMNTMLTTIPKRLQRLAGLEDDDENANVIPIFMMYVFLAAIYYGVKQLVATNFPSYAEIGSLAVTIIFFSIIMFLLGDLSGFNA